MYPFREGSFAVRNGWYVAGWADEITRKPLERWLVGQPVVMFRKEDGSAVALSGRCPHRQMPLAAGLLNGDELTCLYHGITFGSDGRCLKVPSQDRAPARYAVQNFPLVERWKWLWIWIGDPKLADKSLIPDHEAIGLTAPGAISIPVTHRQVKGRYALLHDNLFDLSHIAFLHSDNIGVAKMAETPEEVEQGEGWLRSWRNIKDLPCPPAFQAEFKENAKIDRSIDFTFHMPGLHVGQETIALTEDHPTRGGEVLIDSIVFHAITPATPTTCHYFFAVTARGGSYPHDDKAMEHVAALSNAVIDEDVFATEEIERLLRDLDHEPRDLLVRSDATLVRGRAMIQKAIDAEKARVEAVA